MLWLRRRSRIRKYGNHMPACHVVLCVCSLLYFPFFNWASVSIGRLGSLSCLPPGLNPHRLMLTFDFSFLEPSAIQFLHLGALHRWLTLKGASSEFRTLGDIYSGRKDKKKHVTKTTVDTFTARHGLSSMEKKACNYVPSLAAMQLLDYRDGTCTGWWMRPKKKPRKHPQDNNIMWEWCWSISPGPKLDLVCKHTAAPLDRLSRALATRSGNADWTSAGTIRRAAMTD